MDVLKGGVKELKAATETELSSSDPMPTHFPLSHSPEKVMFTNLLLQNGLPQHDTWSTNMEAIEPENYKIGNEIKMAVLALIKTQKYNQLENSGI